MLGGIFLNFSERQTERQTERRKDGKTEFFLWVVEELTFLIIISISKRVKTLVLSDKRESTLEEH